MEGQASCLLPREGQDEGDGPSANRSQNGLFAVKLIGRNSQTCLHKFVLKKTKVMANTVQ
jgi:hypothetical protein